MKLDILLIIIFVIIIIGCGYHEANAPTVRITLPVGYEGEFKIVVDKAFGAEINLINDEYAFTIPVSGTLFVKSDQAFSNWHKFVVEFRDGTSAISLVSQTGTTHRPVKVIRGGRETYVSSTGDGTSHNFLVKTPEKATRPSSSR